MERELGQLQGQAASYATKEMHGVLTERIAKLEGQWGVVKWLVPILISVILAGVGLLGLIATVTLAS